MLPEQKKTIKNLLPEPWNELCVLEIGGYGSLPSISSHLMNGRAHGTKMPLTHTHTTMNVKPNDVKESEKKREKNYFGLTDEMRECEMEMEKVSKQSPHFSTNSFKSILNLHQSPLFNLRLEHI